MVVPEQGQPPLLFATAEEDNSAPPYGAAPARGGRAAAAGGDGTQSVLFGPGGQETVGQPSTVPASTGGDEPSAGTTDPSPSPPAKIPPKVATPAPAPPSSPTPATQVVQTPTMVASPPTETTQPASPSTQQTTLAASLTSAVTSPSVVVQTSIVQGTTVVSTVSGVTIVSVASPSPASQLSGSANHVSLSQSTFTISASSSAVPTVAAAASTHPHTSAAFIIVAVLGSLVLLATLATSLSWLLSYRRTGKSPFPCCGARSRSSEISYDDDASETYSYSIPESRRTSPGGSMTEKFFSGVGGGGTPVQHADDPYTLAAAGAGGAAAAGAAGGLLEKRQSIKRGIAESELENGWDPNSQTYAGGKQNRTFQDPANGRHATPSIYSGSIKSFSMDPANTSAAPKKPALGQRNPFANPPMMTPSSPAVTSTLSDGPYPNPRPLPGGLMVTNLVPGDMTEAEDHGAATDSRNAAGLGVGLPPGWRRAPGGGYETDSGEIYGTPRLGDQSRPRFLSLGSQGGLDVPWAVHAGDRMEDDYATFPSSSVPSRPVSAASTLGGVCPTLPNALQPAGTKPAGLLPLHHQNAGIAPPPTPFPDSSSEGWATTLRTNLLAAITTVTGSRAAPTPTHGLGIVAAPEAGVMRSTSAASSTWSRSSAGGGGGGGGGDADRFTPRFASRTARGSRRVAVMDGVREESCSSAGEQLVSPFSRTNSQNSRSVTSFLQSSLRPILARADTLTPPLLRSSLLPSSVSPTPPHNPSLAHTSPPVSPPRSSPRSQQPPPFTPLHLLHHHRGHPTRSAPAAALSAGVLSRWLVPQASVAVTGARGTGWEEGARGSDKRERKERGQSRWFICACDVMYDAQKRWNRE